MNTTACINVGFVMTVPPELVAGRKERTPSLVTGGHEKKKSRIRKPRHRVVLIALPMPTQRLAFD